MNLRTILFLFLIGLPLPSNGQAKWLATEQGNAFDGLSRMAYNLDNNEEVALTILNKTNSVNLKFQSLEDFLKGSLALVVNSEKYPTKKFSPVLRVLMSFDRNPEVYYVDFDADEGYISIKNAISADYTKFFNRYEIINLLKRNSSVHFRLVYKNQTNEDYTILLINSSSAIDKTLKYSSDYSIEILLLAHAWAEAWDDKLYHWKISENVETVLKKEFGPYAFRLVDSIYLSRDKQILEIYLKYDLGEIKIPRGVFLKDALDEEGNLIPSSNFLN